MGISPSVWRTMIRFVGVKSLVDLGCGKGVSASWFWKVREVVYERVPYEKLPSPLAADNSF